MAPSDTTNESDYRPRRAKPAVEVDEAVLDAAPLDELAELDDVGDEAPVDAVPDDVHGDDEAVLDATLDDDAGPSGTDDRSEAAVTADAEALEAALGADDDTTGLIPPPDPQYDLQPHNPHWHHPQLAPPHAQRHSDDSERQQEEGPTMAVNGHDIRMKEFKRAYLRGYSADDVDTFLMNLAVEMDQRERYYRSLELNRSTRNGAAAPVQVQVEPEEELFDDDTASQARHAAAVDASEEIIAEAKATAERGLRLARERAQEMILEAQEQQERAARAEAEVQLRLAHLEQRVGDRAAALAAEARRLDELVAWLAENDLAPDTAEWHTPSHAAPSDGEVVHLPRQAEN